MKVLLVAVLLLLAPHKFAQADEASANSARSSENSPIIPAAEGEGELSLDTESPPRNKRPEKGLAKQLNALCKSDSNPQDCKENTAIDLKNIAKKNVLKKKKVVSPAKETP